MYKVSFNILYASTVHPLIKVHEHMISTKLGSTVQLSCSVEASPTSVNYWIKKGGGAREMGEQRGLENEAEYIALTNSLGNTYYSLIYSRSQHQSQPPVFADGKEGVDLYSDHDPDHPRRQAHGLWELHVRREELQGIGQRDGRTAR